MSRHGRSTSDRSTCSVLVTRSGRRVASISSGRNAVDLRVRRRSAVGGARRGDSSSARDPSATRSAGDVVLPDGAAVWLDGGPIRHRRADRRRAGAARDRARARLGSSSPLANDHHAELAADQLAAVTTRRLGADHRSGRVGQDTGAHRTGPPPRRRLARAAGSAHAGRVQQARPGGDAGPHSPICRACRCARSTRSRWRSSTASRRSLPAAPLAHDRRARGAHAARALVQSRRQAQRRSAGAVDRRPQRDPARAASTRRRGGRYGGDVDGLGEVWPQLPRRARSERRGRLRRADRPGDRVLLTQPDARARRAAGVPGAARRRVPRPHAGPHAARAAAQRHAAARCSASATTTRRSTATTAPTRLADRVRRHVPRVPATIRSRSTTGARPASSRSPTGCCATTGGGSPR